jgi:hypothetical protein
MIGKEILCDRCLVHFDQMIAEGRPEDIDLCKKCIAKINRLVEEGLKGYKESE